MKVSRQLLIRVGFVLVLIIIAIVMYHVGKQHTILIDNNNIDGLRAVDWAMVSVDGQEALEMYPRIRDQALVVGQKHTIEVTYTNEDWEDVTVSVDVTVPLEQNMMMFSLPKYLEDTSAPQDVWLTPFAGMTVAPEAETEATDEAVSDDMGISDGMMMEF